ncbi:uncharacterized protein BO97DRAFT_412078 [Aspergillus homomorphus CBS 101889]|uniref:Uncharacterized protein n=1 Tax=Aspergillus homomorphus (strain CBS 101889) TaxID=1450537 RepID=A0A395I3I8_ASPHC|nr:hypothetical protein BO97DRAFT_412078 [Aspergillus homomorphus CBS 101889]RAL14772.1 hypothetical protein BO97DRAFT_412078 [Aspergillus homomorphus CBS 101889]
MHILVFMRTVPACFLAWQGYYTTFIPQVGHTTNLMSRKKYGGYTSSRVATDKFSPRMITDQRLAVAEYSDTSLPPATSHAIFPVLDVHMALGIEYYLVSYLAIIGGDSSGTYCAINLKGKGKSVIVVEKEGRLGGHVHVYVDPTTGNAMDFGAAIFPNTTWVRSDFARFGIPLNEKPPLASSRDLSMQFGRFVEKYEIQAALPSIYLASPGAGDFLSKPVLEVFRTVPSDVIEDAFTPSSYDPPDHTALELYTRESGNGSSRKNYNIALAVYSQRHQACPRQKATDRYPPQARLPDVLAQPQHLRATPVWQIHQHRKNVAVVNNTGFPGGTIHFNRGSAHTQYDFPYLPELHSLIPGFIPGFELAVYSTPRTRKSDPMPDEAVRTHILQDIRRILEQNPDQYSHIEPHIVAFFNHAPFSRQVRAENIKDGWLKGSMSFAVSSMSYMPLLHVEWPWAAFVDSPMMRFKSRPKSRGDAAGLPISTAEGAHEVIARIPLDLVGESLSLPLRSELHWYLRAPGPATIETSVDQLYAQSYMLTMHHIEADTVKTVKAFRTLKEIALGVATMTHLAAKIPHPNASHWCPETLQSLRPPERILP